MKKLGIVAVIIVSSIVVSTDLKAQSNWEVGVRGFDNCSPEATIPIGTAPRFHPAVYFDIAGDFGAGYLSQVQVWRGSEIHKSKLAEHSPVIGFR